jgi:hypothetical protein
MARAQTPIAIRSSIDLGALLPERIRAQLPRRMSQAAGAIERATVRFEDLNGPRGGVDTVCRIKLVLAGRPSILVEKRAGSAGPAFAAAARAIETAVARTSEHHRLRGGRRASSAGSQAARPAAPPDDGEIIGRRVGRGAAAMARALERPEKLDRAADVDTAAPGVSASARRAGGGMTARRNSRASSDRATAALEDSRTRPSRKSTRKSGNRGKPSQGKERNAVAQMLTPRARRSRR